MVKLEKTPNDEIKRGAPINSSTDWINYTDWKAEKEWTIKAEKRWLSIPENIKALNKVFEALQKLFI